VQNLIDKNRAKMSAEGVRKLVDQWNVDAAVDIFEQLGHLTR
jgi:hypothetical protein